MQHMDMEQAVVAIDLRVARIIGLASQRHASTVRIAELFSKKFAKTLITFLSALRFMATASPKPVKSTLRKV
jgi:hypothetical protein